ncbi:MAG: hypothetical protein ACRCVQ_13665 [Acinetobacter ursingii]
MTFILATQLEDSIIVTTDNRSVTIAEDGHFENINDTLTKLYAWERGIITGSGEHTVIKTSVELFIKISKSKIQMLPKCLYISRKLRELQTEHFQITISKLLYSEKTEDGIQLHIIEPDEIDGYRTTSCKKNEIILWLFKPNITSIISIIQDLYSKLQPRRAFQNQQEWFNYYINDFCKIYKIQAQYDPLMSQSFDFFFQAKDGYLIGHIPNTQNIRIEFNKI